jgi:hypothetical protein
MPKRRALFLLLAAVTTTIATLVPSAYASADKVAAEGNCLPNYDPCVEPALDVDCVGGGDGPAFVQGPIRVVSLDIYNLDGDGNGIGCEPAPPKSSTPTDEVVIVVPPPGASVAATAVHGSPRFTG